MSAGWWLLIPSAPLLAAALLPIWRDRFVPWLWLACVPALVAALWPPPLLGMGFVWPGCSWGAPDELSRGWLAFTAVLWGCATVFANAEIQTHRLRFWLFWLVSLSGNLLLVIAQDVLSFYTGFTVMSIAAYGLVVHRGGPQPRRAGRIYLQLAVTGEMILLAALAMRAWAAGGSLSLSQWQTVPIDGPGLLLLLVGFGLKAGFWPLHVWLPLAHPAAPSPASAVLSGAMIEAGILGLWRTLPAVDPFLHQWALGLVALGMFSALYGVVAGLGSGRAKAALAYSSISQMGYFLMILGLAWRHPEYRAALSLLLVVFAAHHGMAKGALFLSAGIHPLRGPGWLLVILPALAISGLPLTSGGAAKGELKHWLQVSDFVDYSNLLLLATAGTTLLLARALWLLHREDGQQREQEIGGSPSSRLAWGLLCLLPLGMPWVWPAFRGLLYDSLSWSTVWQLLLPMGVAVGISVVAVALDWRVPNFLRDWHRPVLHLSFRIRRTLHRPPLPQMDFHPDFAYWRQLERRWNHFWNSRGIVASSAWLLVLVLVLGVIWSAF